MTPTSPSASSEGKEFKTFRQTLKKKPQTEFDPVQQPSTSKLERQDSQLSTLHSCISQQKQLAIKIRDELQTQNSILAGMQQETEKVESKLKKQDAFLNKILKKFY
jgi:hypothetical protein